MSSRSKLHSLREYSLFAAHINTQSQHQFCFLLGRGGGGSVARSAGQNTVREQKNREKNERQMSGEQERHNSSHHGDPERGQSSPRILSEPRLTPPPHSKSPVLLPTGAGWANVVHLGSPRDTNTQMKEQPRKSPFSLSVSQQITLDSRLLRSSVLHRSAQFSFSCSGRLLSPPSRYHLHSDIQSLSVLKSKSALL